MKRWFMALGLVAVASGSVRAEDSVSVWMNYYKERSTRVASPEITIRKDLPGDAAIDGVFLVDQITSASGAFTVTDEPFTEYRVEGRVAGRKTFGNITPGVSFRLSRESDYTSLGFGARTTVSLFDGASTLEPYVRVNLDWIGQRGSNDFSDKLNTYFFGATWTQIMRRNLIGGLNVSAQFLRGYQENVYRVEQHPRHRNRYSVGGWLRYRIPSTKTTFMGGYCFYGGTWKLFANTFDLRVTQAFSPIFSVEPRFRFHVQDDIFFTDRTFIPDPNNPNQDIVVRTTDPKLFAGTTVSAGLRLSFLLKEFWQAKIQPSYMWYRQSNRYGTAHIIQLGVHVPL